MRSMVLTKINKGGDRLKNKLNNFIEKYPDNDFSLFYKNECEGKVSKLIEKISTNNDIENYLDGVFEKEFNILIVTMRVKIEETECACGRNDEDFQVEAVSIINGETKTGNVWHKLKINHLSEKNSEDDVHEHDDGRDGILIDVDPSVFDHKIAEVIASEFITHNFDKFDFVSKTIFDNRDDD